MKSNKKVMSLGLGLCALALVGATTSVSAQKNGVKAINAIFNEGTIYLEKVEFDTNGEAISFDTEGVEFIESINLDVEGAQTFTFTDSQSVQEGVVYQDDVNLDAEGIKLNAITKSIESIDMGVEGMVEITGTEIKEENGKIYSSTDDGKTWTEINVIKMEKLLNE